ncbi:hypothetical protein O988_06128 [Pseudogymnoascus sp. VKM F-3808]|nr:hypothetical protein O988_06128 [Pseudogymnoascus sp. VKM F-3808]
MSDDCATKRLYGSSSSSASAGDSLATTTATTPDPSQSRRESEQGTNDATSSTAFNPAKVSIKLSGLAAAAKETPILPGSDEGHPNDPLLRVYDPTKDENLSIEELLARPRLPRSPFDRVNMGKLKSNLERAADSGEPAKLGPSEKLVAKALVDHPAAAEAALRRADREKHIKIIGDIARDLDFVYPGK